MRQYLFFLLAIVFIIGIDGQVSSQEANCEGVGSWKVDCNVCHCNGNQGACTLRGCLPGFPPRGSSEPECDGKIRWKRDCNWCYCIQGRASCTKIFCGPNPVNNVRPSLPVPPRPEILEREADCTYTGEGRWRNDCNWCRCTSTGLAICTLKGCPPSSFPRDTVEPECEGIAFWRRDCNQCRCDKGKALCTKRSCERNTGDSVLPSIQIAAPPVPRPTDREPDCHYTGEGRWRNGCNWCSCTESGFAICTLVGCISISGGPVRDTSEPVCEGNSRWRRDCNWCRCSGGKAFCTKRFCEINTGDGIQSTLPIAPVVPLPEINTGDGIQSTLPIAPVVPLPVEKERTCERTGREDRWREDCNWCHCGFDETSQCTRAACPSDPALRDTYGPECRGNSIWKQDCNWCRCTNERASCTKKFCARNREDGRQSTLPIVPSPVPVPERTCERTGREDRWREDCNWCHCGPNETGVCTLKACPLDPALRDTFGPECRGNAVWKRDCNWCRCTLERASCTKKFCGVPSKLEPSIPNSPSVNPGSAIREDPDRDCNFTGEGDRWRRSCNWCRCSETGLGLCTRKGCLPQFITRYDDQPHCEGKAEWREDCNWCSCVNGRAICTTIACINN